MAHHSIEKAVIVGSNGGFGVLLSQHLALESIRVAGIDINPAPSSHGSYSDYVCADVTNLDQNARALLRNSDCIILCLPEGVAIQAFLSLVDALAPRSLLLDILSVKMPIVRLMRESRKDVELISIHPMFGPAVGFQSQNVVVVEVQFVFEVGAVCIVVRESRPSSNFAVALGEHSPSQRQ